MSGFLIRVFKNINYAEEFVNQGKISFSRIKNYHVGDDTSLRTDPLEGASKVITPARCEDLRLTISSSKSREVLKALKVSSLQFREFNCLPEHGFLLSMAYFSFDEFGELPNEPGTLFCDIPQDFRRFGDSLVFVPWEYIKPLIDIEIKNLGYQSSSKLVTYRDPEKGIDSWDIFSKPIEYSWQKEYRYVVKACNVAPMEERISITIGSLEGLAQIVPIEQTKNFGIFAYPRN